MKFVILVKATKGSEAGTMPSEEDLAGVLAYNQELVRAGVMLDGVGLSPTSEGFRVRFSAEGKNGEIEVRGLFELEEFEQGPVIEGFRELEEMESIAKDVERTRPDLSGAVAPNGTVTVLFTDIEGSTQLTEDLGDREWMEVLRKHNQIVREQLALHSGFEVKSQGDGFMLAFSSARDALRCARGIQRAVAESDSNGHRLRVRVRHTQGRRAQGPVWHAQGRAGALAGRLGQSASASPGARARRRSSVHRRGRVEESTRRTRGGRGDLRPSRRREKGTPSAPPSVRLRGLDVNQRPPGYEADPSLLRHIHWSQVTCGPLRSCPIT